MKKKVINMENHGLRDLDAIVADVLDAVELEARRRLGLRETGRERETENGNGKDAEILPGKIRKHHERSMSHEAEGVYPLPEDKSAGADVINVEHRRKPVRERPLSPESWADISPEFETELDRSDDVLFDKDEEIFIRQSVAFLRSRDNKDVIIARIWNLLTEAEPEAFYSPGEESAENPGEKRQQSTSPGPDDDPEAEGGEDDGMYP